jgi:hypothetical protein
LFYYLCDEAEDIKFSTSLFLIMELLKKVLYVYVNMNDNINQAEGERFVNKLIESGLLVATNKYEKEAVIKKFRKSNNLIEILLEIVERDSVSDSICSEYEVLSDEAKTAYGLTSLTYKYDLKIKWELLRRAIENRYVFTWQDFVQKILNGDAKGNMFSEEIQGYYFVRGRHRFISELIISIHYKGNFSEEIADIKNLVKASCGNEYEERFIGKLLYSIISNNHSYSDEQMEEILDFTIDNFKYADDKAFVNHIKGEFFISNKEYEDAIRCFDTNVQNEANLPYSLHSLVVELKIIL